MSVAVMQDNTITTKMLMSFFKEYLYLCIKIGFIDFESL